MNRRSNEQYTQAVNTFNFITKYQQSDQKNTTYKLPASSVTLMRCSAGTGMDTISSNAAGLQKYPSCKQKEIQ